MGDAYSQGQMVALGIVFLIFSTSFVGLRVWAKTLGRAGVSWDDHLIFVALAITIGACAAQIIAATSGQLGQHQTDLPNGMPILNDPRFLIYEKCKFAIQMLSYSGLGFSKASILVLYMRIFTQRPFRICAIVMLALVIAWTISFFFASLLQCFPITALVEAFYGNKCVDTIPLWYTGSITDIIIDFMILAMPIPMVWNLHLPTKQRIGVLAMFLLGATTCAASIARLVIFVQVGSVLTTHYNDETYYTSPVFFWTVIELALSVISACLPTLRPIYLRFKSFPKAYGIGSKLSSSGYRNHGYPVPDSASQELSIPLADREPRVQTSIEANHMMNPGPLPEKVIMVSRDISNDDMMV